MIRAQPKKEFSGEDPAEIKKTILPAIEAFVAIQQTHASLIEKGQVMDVLSWREEREKVFQRLFCQFEFINSNSSCFEADFLRQVQGKLKEMIDGEDQLRSLVARQQEVMGEKLQTMRKGKKALHGYRVSDGSAPRPKFHSSRM